MKSALIVGVSGQDGAYIASNLLHHGYTVFGTTRKLSPASRINLEALSIADRVTLFDLDITTPQSISDLIDHLKPHLIFHLGGLTSVSLSFANPIEAHASIYLSTLYLLEAVRLRLPQARIFIPCSTDCFGDTSPSKPASEDTELNPCSPYALAKANAFKLAHFYRQSYNLFVSVGILTNHESPLRGPQFVTSKLVRSIKSILMHQQSTIELGNISVIRDWCWAPDVCIGITKLMHLHHPETVILASGHSSSLEHLIKLLFEYAGLGDYKSYLSITSDLTRSNEIPSIYLSPARASRVIPWTHSTQLDVIAQKLIQSSLF